MRLMNISNGEATIVISEDELAFLCQAINETLSGINIREFKTRTGETPEKAESLMLQLESFIEEIVKRETSSKPQ